MYAAPTPGGSAAHVGSKTLQHVTAPFAACYRFGFGSSTGGFRGLVLSRHRLQLASGSQNQALPAGVRALTCPVAQRNLFPQKRRFGSLNSSKPDCNLEIFH